MMENVCIVILSGTRGAVERWAVAEGKFVN